MQKVYVLNPAPPKQLFSLKDHGVYQPVTTVHGDTPVWVCGECGLVYGHRFPNDKPTFEQATNCCKIGTCKCGSASQYNNYGNCIHCNAKERGDAEQAKFDSAELVTEMEHEFIFVPDLGDREGYFESMIHLTEWVADHNSNSDRADEIDMPEFAFCCREKKIANEHIDAGDIIENLTQEFHEDAADSLDQDGLQKLLDNWLAEQSVVSYEVDYTRKVKVVV